jgi:hypothetical protein
MRFSAEDCNARAAALEHAAEALEGWTEDPIERSQGEFVAKHLKQEAESCRARAEEHAYGDPAAKDLPVGNADTVDSEG